MSRFYSERTRYKIRSRAEGSPTEVFSEVAPDADTARARSVERVTELYPDMFIAVLKISELEG